TRFKVRRDEVSVVVQVYIALGVADSETGGANVSASARMLAPGRSGNRSAVKACRCVSISSMHFAVGARPALAMFASEEFRLGGAVRRDSGDVREPMMKIQM